MGGGRKGKKIKGGLSDHHSGDGSPQLRSQGKIGRIRVEKKGIISKKKEEDLFFKWRRV